MNAVVFLLAGFYGTSLAQPQTPTYTLCTSGANPYEGRTIPPMQITKAQQTFQGINYQIAGTLSIVDRCSVCLLLSFLKKLESDLS
jgi:hypothetical protein